MGAAVLLHIVFASEGLVALRAEGILLAGVLLGMASSVSGCGEEIAAVVDLCKWAGILVLLGRSLVGSRSGT